jgi:hypothetical protein
MIPIKPIIKKLVVIIMAISLLSLLRFFTRQKYDLVCGPGIETEKTSYREGEKVKLRVHTVLDEITDLYVDGEIMPPGPGSDDEWYIYTFPMPAHDVKAECVSRNISVVDPEEESTLLISCYSRVVGTPVDMPFERVRLFRETDGSLRLHREYGLPGDLDITECTVKEECLEEAMEYILENGMDKWPELDECDPLDGYYCSCGFLLDGKWISVDTESPMPSGGNSIIDGVRAVLMRHASD